MTPIKTIVIDDEENGKQVLIDKIKIYCPDLEIIGEASNGLEGLALAHRLKPQLVFLDVEMPKMNGFEMLKQWHDRSAQIVFTTAYDQYAIKAIKNAAIDYLLKPIDIDELILAVNKVKKIISHQSSSDINPVSHKNQNTKIAISSETGLLFVNIADIIRLEASGNYTRIILKDKSVILASKTLKDFEDILTSYSFFRCHHAHIINSEYISKYIKADGGTLVMKDGTNIDISRRKKQEFLDSLLKMIESS